MKKLLASLTLAILLVTVVLVGITLADEPDPWITLVQPHVADPGDADLDSQAAKTWADWRAHHTGPNPRAYQRLMMNEAKALAAGTSPQVAGLDVVSGTAQVLAFLIEFNPSANDVFTNFSAPDYDGACYTITHTFNGPLHDQMAQPGPRDNNTLWLESFPVSYYEDVLFGDGSSDIVIRGADHPNSMTVKLLSLAQYYDEASRGTFEITGTVVPTWFVLPHSEAWYAAAACAEGQTGMSGHPDNIEGVQQAVIDAVDAFNAISQTLVPGFDWNDYDTDGDGIVDHVVVMHAGVGAESGYTVTDTFNIWAHSSDVMPAQGGYEVVPGIVVMNYTMQPENVEVGVLAHEFGHDLGLPDYYDTSGSGVSDPVWWALMNTGSHPGPGAIGTMPTHLTSWSKFVFGWIDPVWVTDTAATEVITIGQTSNPPAGTDDAVFIELPVQEALIHAPHSGAKSWWSNFDVAWGDARLAHDVDLTGASGTVTMSFWLNYATEEDWDFAFVEVLSGTTWTELQVWDATTGITVTTPDDYSDPNGRMVDYGNKKYGISGESHGWVHLYADLSAYAGSDIDVRFRYCTDAGFQMDGVSLDDVAVPAIGWSDDMEGASTWVPEVSSFAGAALGEGWKMLTDGTEYFSHYYIAEWRNYDGFDNGLQYAYQTWLYDDPDEWAVNKMKANAPGMLVWYRNSRYKDNHMGSHVWDAPSTAPKGQLLIVDSHYEPYVRPEDNGEYALNTLPGRPQSTDVAFNLWGSHAFTVTAPVDENNSVITNTLYPARTAAPAFHDSLGYFPGFRTWLYWVDNDASVCVPSVDNQVYSTRIVERTGSAPLFDYEPAYDYYGIDLWGDGLTILGSGNPGDDNAQLGWNIELIAEDVGGTWGQVQVYNQRVEFETTHTSVVTGVGVGDMYTVTYQTVVENAGDTVANNVYVTYTLDAALTAVSLTMDDGIGTVEFPPTTVWWTDELPAGAAVTLTLTATGEAASGQVTTRIDADDGIVARGPWFFDTDVTATYYVYLPVVMRNSTGTLVIP